MNSDAILIMGSSMAENHPVGFQWVIEARERGAKIIHVDPRFNRTSAMADIWVPLRAGSDIAFLGGLINYVLSHNREFREYVVAYTNASTLLRDDFRDTEDLDGMFSGWDAEKKKYDPESWLYRGAPPHDNGSQGTSNAGYPSVTTQAGHSPAGGGHGKDRGGEAADVGKFESDPTLQNPRCVLQVLKRHFARYTPEMVERVCGVPKEVFFKSAETFASASGPEKTAAICYAVGQVEADEIDRLNILGATRLAMMEALGQLTPSADFLLIDAIQLKESALPQKAIIGGDSVSASIAAASIIAKTYRDSLMRAFHEVYPQYGFTRHVGYGTRVHWEALNEHGPCPLHRKSFRGVLASGEQES